MTHRNLPQTLIVLALGLFLIAPHTGCVGYKLGSNLPPGIRSVFVPMFINDTGEPGLESPTTSAAIEEIQKDGSLQVRPRDQADCVLEVKLTTYKLVPVRYRKDQTTTAQEYRLELTADFVLKKLPGNEIVAQGTKIVGFTNLQALSDLPSARRTALQPTARDLAYRIIREITEYW
jgi:hypothetical protein